MRRLFLAALMLGTFCAIRANAAEPQPADEEVAKMNNAFATALYAKLADKGGNLFFSPTSVQTALAMAWAGARGPTAEQMARTLQLEGNAPGPRLGQFLAMLNADGKKGAYELAVANALWAAKGYPIRPDYLELVKKDYDGYLSEENFATDPEGSRKQINEWVAQKTADKIPDLLPANSITPATRLVLTNAIYFKGKWDEPFNKAQTRDGDFTTSTGQRVQTPMMHQQKHFRYAEDDDVQLLELPYGQNDLAMWVFLPKKADGLPAFEKGLTSDRLTKLAEGSQSQDVRVWLPRFKIDTGFGLSDVLKSMGMTLAFNPAEADFSGITSAEHLFISDVIHKAFVNVDEEGTEAAAATGITMRATAVLVRREPKEFKADHPFLFAIVHQKSGAILFMGRLTAP